MKTGKLAGALALAAILAGPAWAGDFGKGVEAYDRGDYAAALAEWNPLAEQGVAEAQYNLGVMYRIGDGVEQDYVSAYVWWNIAAAGGYEDASGNKDIVSEHMTPGKLPKPNGCPGNVSTAATGIAPENHNRNKGVKMEQGTDEWFAARSGKVTASRIKCRTPRAGCRGYHHA